ncbi:uncharacterized protein LOC141902895 [Tubulanus polymorphus]|uniref:uncharacterized protein LOC141902895 n=1 Tax=Tubulanus polymorphus TaxID=672921 RepID=UPI003DA570C2
MPTIQKKLLTSTPSAMNFTNITNSTDGLPNWYHIYGLVENCRSDWPVGLCVCFNLCGLTSTAIWFLVILPQLYKNYRHKSVAGLSLAWATMDVTASLLNMCFVYGSGRDPLPLYIKIQAVYLPVLGLILLTQFYRYSNKEHYKFKWKLVYTVSCLFVWIGILVLDSCLDVYRQFQWVAIILWSTELFPQIILNIIRKSTSGQSTVSVSLAVAGRSTDFLSAYGLLMPIQYVSMTYFTCSLVYINAAQVVWFWRNGEGIINTHHLADVDLRELSRDRTESNISTVSVELSDPDERTDRSGSQISQDSGNALNPDQMENVEIDGTFTGNFNALRTISIAADEDEVVIFDAPVSSRPGVRFLLKMNYKRTTLLSLIFIALTLFSVGFVWCSASFLALIAPLIIILIITCAVFIINRLPKTITYKIFK